MEEGSGCRKCVYLLWIHVDIWQNQYNIVRLKNKINLKNYCLFNENQPIVKFIWKSARSRHPKQS